MALKIRIHERNDVDYYNVTAIFNPTNPFTPLDKDFLFKGVDFDALEKTCHSEEEALAYARNIANELASKNNNLEVVDYLDEAMPYATILFTDVDTIKRLRKDREYSANNDLWGIPSKQEPDDPVQVALVDVHYLDV